LNKKFIILTCGDFDLKLLSRECIYKKINYEDYLKDYINIKKVFPAKYYSEEVIKSKRLPGMAEMLNCLKMELIGKHHSGIDDAFNIARIA
jgi:ERI1 exoribonuclease 3